MAIVPAALSSNPKSVREKHDDVAVPPHKLLQHRRRAQGGAEFENSCQYAGDGMCDDGSESSMQYCAAGSDCADCGPAHCGSSLADAPSTWTIVSGLWCHDEQGSAAVYELQPTLMNGRAYYATASKSRRRYLYWAPYGADEDPSTRNSEYARRK